MMRLRMGYINALAVSFYFALVRNLDVVTRLEVVTRSFTRGCCRYSRHIGRAIALCGGPLWAATA